MEVGQSRTSVPNVFIKAVNRHHEAEGLAGRHGRYAVVFSDGRYSTVDFLREFSLVRNRTRRRQFHAGTPCLVAQLGIGVNGVQYPKLAERILLTGIEHVR